MVFVRMAPPLCSLANALLILDTDCLSQWARKKAKAASSRICSIPIPSTQAQAYKPAQIPKVLKIGSRTFTSQSLCSHQIMKAAFRASLEKNIQNTHGCRIPKPGILHLLSSKQKSHHLL